ncbi:hypothetical protein Acr_24g0010620 [Actinidia rufa]|uniref:Uncharacterized protein n=1 Tax=Actinidia rufa TaxID=165716 RepID=A0A7J0GVQ9_9ERIC|nr:hypothetical protein Acr_24g0010620 [Actinidia rufa]
MWVCLVGANAVFELKDICVFGYFLFPGVADCLPSNLVEYSVDAEAFECVLMVFWVVGRDTLYRLIVVLLDDCDNPNGCSKSAPSMCWAKLDLCGCVVGAGGSMAVCGGSNLKYASMQQDRKEAMGNIEELQKKTAEKEHLLSTYLNDNTKEKLQQAIEESVN